MLIMHIGLFSRHISRTQSFQQNRHINFLALVALKLLVSLISRLVACSRRHTQTHRTTTVTFAAHARRGLIMVVDYAVGIYSGRHTNGLLTTQVSCWVSSFYRKCQPKISFCRESRNSAIVNERH